MRNPRIIAVASALLLCSSLVEAAVFPVDTVGDVGLESSLQMNGDQPIVSYHAGTAGTLKVATCIAACGTATASWILSTVDNVSATSWGTSLQLQDGRPVVAYHNGREGTLKLATCVAGCATETPAWVMTTVDNSSADVGLFPSLQLLAGNPVISYRDRTRGDLKLATCTAGCATASPTWVITTVDSMGDVGRYTSLQLNEGKPVVSYFDVTRGIVKLATCTAACATTTPSWTIATVDSSPGDEDLRFSMQLVGGNPVISYYDIPGRALKVATCSAGCATATPTWTISTVEAGAVSTGAWSSLQVAGGRPIVSYYAHGDLKLAECMAGCGTTAATWAISSLDTEGEAGWLPSLQIRNGTAFVTYYHFTNGDLRLATAALSGPVPSTGTAVEYYHAGFDHYFVTDLLAEISALDAGRFEGWTRTGATFSVHTIDSGFGAQVCRFFSTRFQPKSSHFYTPFADECEIVKGNADWQYEGTVFGIRLPDATGACPAAERPLYRLYNGGRGGAPNHRYTISTTIRSEMVAQGWIPEGVGALGVIGCVAS